MTEQPETTPEETTKPDALEPWQHRVVEEQEALAGKIKRLQAFIERGEFGKLNAKQKGLLAEQMSVMKRYLVILNERIKRF